MGSRVSKVDSDTEFTSTPSKQTPISVKTNFEMETYLDPRSPNSCRTPLGEILEHYQKQPQIDIYQQNTPVALSGNSGGILRKKFLKGFTYNLHDPRSPSLQLNRTPIVFENLDNPNDKSFTLDDTFSDLFVENSAPPPTAVEIAKPDEPVEPEEPTTPEEIQKIEPKSKEIDTEIVRKDPRSPTVDVDRTPIIFTDDAPDESEMIESILETLSLNQTEKLENKPLERVRNNKPKKNSRKVRKNRIFEDNENVLSTPTGRMQNSPQGKRTPLSCVANKRNLLLNSVEKSGKSIKRTGLVQQRVLGHDDDNLSNAKELHFPVENNENSVEIY